MSAKSRFLPPSPVSPWVHLGSIWITPTITFTRLRTNWVWTPAYVALIICLLSSNVMLTNTIYQAMANAGSGSDWAPFVTLVVKISLVSGPFIQPLVRAFVVSLLIALISTLLGVSHRFGKLYSLAMWTLLPSMGLATLTKAAIMTLTDQPITSTVRTDLLAWVPLEPGSWWMNVASVLDIFQLWSLVLVSLGFAMIHKCSKRTAWVLGVGIFLAEVGLVFVWTL